MQGDLWSWEVGDGKNKNVVAIFHIDFRVVEIEQKDGMWRDENKSRVEFGMEGKSRIKKKSL